MPGYRKELALKISNTRLKELREERMLTQGELAELAGLSVYTVHAAEHGRNVSPKTGRALSAALGVDPGELLPKGRAPQPLDSLVDGVSPEDLEGHALGLANLWNQDVELYQQNNRAIQPYRTYEMRAAVLILSQQFFGVLGVLQRHAQELGLDSDVSTWEPQFKQMLVEVGASIQALAELYEMIERSAADPGIDREDFRAMREEFAVSLPASLTEDPHWPEALEQARTLAGLA